MGGVWNTYTAGAGNGIVKNCKIPPRQDHPPDTIRRSPHLCEKTDFFHIRFLLFSGYCKYRFFVN